MAAKNIITLTAENFDREVIKSDMPVLVDFWAEWCGPCRMVAPIMDELASEYEGRAKVGKINVDEQRELAEKYRIMSIPTVMLFKNGEIIEKIVGARTKADFAKMIENNL